MIVKCFLASSEKPMIQELWEYILETYLTPKYGVYRNITIDPDPSITPAMIFFAVFFAIIAACAVTVFNKRTLGRPVRYLLKHDAIGRSNAKTLAEVGLEKPGVLKYFINRFTLSKAIRCVEEDEFYGIEVKEGEPEEEKTCEEAEETVAESSNVGESMTRRDYKKKLKREKREEAKRLSPMKVKEIRSRSENAYYIAAISTRKYKRRAESDRFYIEEGMQYRAQIRFSAKGSNPMIILLVAVAYIIIGVLVIKLLPGMLSFVDAAIGNFK